MEAYALRWVIVYTSDEPRLMVHEHVHLAQQKEIGFLVYCWKYLISKDFRARVEVTAYACSHPDWSDFYLTKHVSHFYRVPWDQVARIVSEVRKR